MARAMVFGEPGRSRNSTRQPAVGKPDKALMIRVPGKVAVPGRVAVTLKEVYARNQNQKTSGIEHPSSGARCAGFETEAGGRHVLSGTAIFPSRALTSSPERITRTTSITMNG